MSTTIGKTLEHYIGLALASSGAKVDSLMRTDLRTACEGLDKDIETLLERTKPLLESPDCRGHSKPMRSPIEPPPPSQLAPVTEGPEFAEVPDRVVGMEHTVKSWPSSFQAIKSGLKTFDMRINDRGYREGDILRLREYAPGTDKPGTYTGDQCRRKIVFVQGGAVAITQGLKPNHCILGLAEVRE